MDPYRQTHSVIPLQNQPQGVGGIGSTSQGLGLVQHQPQGTTSNYVVQLNPNSGNFEIIDSSLASIPSSRSAELVCHGVGGGGGGDDEAVYKIRDEDFYIRGPLTEGHQHEFSEIDIDPASVLDMSDLFSRNIQVLQQASSNINATAEHVQMGMGMQTVPSIQMPTIQFVQQNQTHPIQAQLQIQPSQHQPQINYVLEEVGGVAGVGGTGMQDGYQIHQQTTNTGGGCGGGTGGQVSGTIMSIVSSFISPGATALRVDDNLIIYNPSGQIIQIPLPNQSPLHSQNVVCNTSSSSQQQYQAVQVSNSTDFGWVGVDAVASSGPTTSNYPISSTTVPIQQYNSAATIQYANTQDNHNIGFAIPTTTATEQNPYYTMQNLQLLPLASTIQQTSTTETLVAVPEASSAIMTSGSHDYPDISKFHMDDDERDSVDVVVRELNKFFADVQPTLEKQITTEARLPTVATNPVPTMEFNTLEASPNSAPVISSKIGRDIEEQSIIPEVETTTTTLNSEVDANRCPNTTIPLEDFYPIESVTDNTDDFDIKIVSCFSLSQASQNPTKTDEHIVDVDVTKDSDIRIKIEANEENVNPDSSSGEQVKTLESDDLLKCIKSEPEPEPGPGPTTDLIISKVKDAGYFVKAIKKLTPIVLLEQSRTPNIPLWLSSGYVDEDDELLNAFKNRVDPMKTDICQLCYSWFSSTSDLRKHMKKDHVGKDGSHPCSICGAMFFARVLRLRHEKLHKYDLKYRASVYLRQPELKTHFRKRFRPCTFSPWYESHVKKVCKLVEDLPFTCFDCGMEFSSSDYVQDHNERIHATQVCGFCDKPLENAKALINHEQEFHGHYTITENYVGGAWNLWDHWMCEESTKKDVILSNIAFFHSYDAPSLEVPKVFEEDFIDRPLESEGDCAASENVNYEQCEDAFFDEESCNDGIRLPFACDQCSKSYDNEFDLRRHGRCHGSPSKANLACQFCGRVFKTHSHKKEHERTHTGEKPYVCPICQRSFIQSSNLKKHMQTHKQTSLQCSTCGKQFIKEASLILHQRAHAQDRKFRCAICDRAYNYASLLKRHMRIHTGEMPYSCESCGMLFHELVSLHYHRKKVHTGERPHKCDTCGRAFILSSDLKKHVQIHLKPHPERPVVLKPMRKRSQSKSFDKSDGFDTPSSSPNSRSSANRIPANFFISGDIHTLRNSEEIKLENDFEDDVDNQSMLSPSPSPCSSLENEIISNKPAVVRVYSRRDPKLNSPTLTKVKEIQPFNVINEPEPLPASTTFQNISSQQEINSHLPVVTEPMEIDNESESTVSAQHHSSVNIANSSAIQRDTDSNPPKQERRAYHSLISTEDAALLLAINRGDFHHHNESFPTSHQVINSNLTTQVTNAKAQPKTTDDVLQLSGTNQFNDLIQNMMDVPEAASEIEILFGDEQNHSMR